MKSKNAISDLVATFDKGASYQRPPASYYTLLDGTDTARRAFYAGFSPDGNPSVLIPLAEPVQSVSRIMGGMSLRAVRETQISFDGATWRECAAVLECIEPDLLWTFCAISASLGERVAADGAPRWSDLVAAFEEWERLLSRRRRLDTSEELGLWGELWLIDASNQPDRLVDAWQGPDRELIDFVLLGKGFEVKTTRKAATHHVSQAQADSTLSAIDVYFVSLLVVQDALGGTSLPELAARLFHRCSAAVELERHLLAAGYSKADAPLYSKRYRLGAPPAIYRRADVPRVRSVDPGVSEIRYRVDLDQGLALADQVSSELFLLLGLGSESHTDKGN